MEGSKAKLWRMGSTGVGRTACEGENGRNAEGEMVWEMFDKQIVGV